MARRPGSVLVFLALTAGAGVAAAEPPRRDASAVIGVRNAHAMAYDSHRSRIVLFGGADASEVRGDTWEWNGARWARVSPAGPPPRTFPAMAYDSRRRRIVLFGGNRVLFGADPPADDTFLGDTWEWDGRKWVRVAASGPTARAEAAIAFDEARERVVLFGGYHRVGGKIRRLDDTWEWDGARWQAIRVAGPSPRNGAAQVFDRRRGAIVLVGGRAERGTSAETWEWNGQRWSDDLAASAQGIFNCALAYDLARSRIVRFGGYLGKQRVGETWELDGASWTQIESTGPSPRNHTAMAYDAKLRRTVLFGGHDGTRVFGDTWEWDGTRWRLRETTEPQTHVDNGH